MPFTIDPLDPPVALTEQQLYDVFSGSEPEQIAMRNLIKTLFSQQVTPGPTPDPTSASWSGAVDGLGVAYSGTGLVFDVAAGTYRINGTLYSSIEQSVELDEADADDNRIDTIYIDTDGTVGVITGTPDTNPSTPTVDPTTQLFLTSVFVPEDATDLTVQFADVNIYLEDAEWTTTEAGTGFASASTAFPFAGTKSIEGTAVAANASELFANSTPISFDGDGNLLLRIASKATWHNNAWLTFQWRLAGIAKGQPISLTRQSFGFDSAITNVYQLAVIPRSTFQVPAGTLVDQLLIRKVGNQGIGFYIDNVILQTNNLPVVNTKQLENFVIACSDETTALVASTGVAKFRVPYACTVVAVSAALTTAQASGSIFTVDVNESGTTILSTKLTIDNTETTSATAATPAVVNDNAIAANAEISIDIDQIGMSGATGLKVTLVVRQI